MARQIYEYHPIIGHKYIPSIKVRHTDPIGTYNIITNSAGFRSNIEFEPKIGMKTRFLFFGDSYTDGGGVANEHRFSDLLMSKNSNLETYNFGLSGTGTDQQYLIYENYGKSYNNDLVVIGMQLENIKRVNVKYRTGIDPSGKLMCYMKPYFQLEKNELVLTNTPIERLPVALIQMEKSEQKMADNPSNLYRIKEIANRLGVKDILKKFIKYDPLPEYSKSSNKEWVLLDAILKKWTIDCKKNNHKVLIFIIPLYSYIEEINKPDNYTKRFDEFRRQTGVTIFDPLDFLLKNYSLEERKEFRFSHDPHPSIKGHHALFCAFNDFINKTKILNG